LKKFFEYPVSLSFNTIKNLGVVRLLKILFSFLLVKIRPRRREKSLEDFFINRFGKELYLTFFKDYTEKVWGVPCSIIKPEWGSQRIKGLSITKVLLDVIRKPFKSGSGLRQKNTETSLIESFMYPKLGPGQIWENVAAIITKKGGEIIFNQKVNKIIHNNKNEIAAVESFDTKTGRTETHRADYFISSMPVKDLVKAMEDPPAEVRNTAEGLVYRDFLTIGLLLKKLKIKNSTKIKTVHGIVPDNWIYIQERDVKIGRLQIFNNWSPYLVKDENSVWLGLEYFCNEGDELWTMADKKLSAFGIAELEKMGIIDAADVTDSTVIRMPKAYPAYFGSYDNFDTIKEYLNQFLNFYPVGRNGMHRYNNADHSMLTAMASVEHIIDPGQDKKLIWEINAEQEYHEKK
jgi:protoporphyrinogen oxidase